jgi:hypothetical protein
MKIFVIYAPHQILLGNRSKNVRWEGHVARIRRRGIYNIILEVRPKGTRPLGRRSRRWEDNIKANFKVTGW